MRAIEREETSVELLLTFFLVTSLYQLVTFRDERLGICQILCGQLALHADELLHQWLVFLEHLVIAFGDRTRDNQRCTGIIDQHGVYLVDDGVVM